MPKFESWFPSGQFDPKGGGEAGMPDFRKRRAEEAEFYARYGLSPAEFKEAERLRGEYPGTLPKGQRPKGATPPSTITPQQEGILSRYGDFRDTLDFALGVGGRRGAGESAADAERKRLEAMMAIYKGKDVLSAEEQAHVAALREAWNKLSGIKTPETLPEEEDEGFWSGIGKSFKSWFGGEKKSPGLQGLE